MLFEGVDVLGRCTVLKDVLVTMMLVHVVDQAV
jgi:hypothetical protein